MGSNPTPSARTLYYSKRGDGRFRFTRWDLNPQGRGGVGEVLPHVVKGGSERKMNLQIDRSSCRERSGGIIPT